MKRKMICMIFMFVFIIQGLLFSQAVFASGFFTHTFGGPALKYTRLNEQDTYLVGARGGLVFDDVFTVGFGGYGLMNDIEINAAQPDTNLMNFGYGGLVAEFIIMPEKLIHAQVYTLLGGGFMSYRKSDKDTGDMFFTLEPGVDAVIKAGSFADIAIGVSYRYVWGVKPATFDGFLTNEDISSFSFNLTLIFD